MGVETTPLQRNLFSDELIDTRTRAQKLADEKRQDWTQIEMFRQRDLAQFGVSANPIMDIPIGKLVLISEDARTEEEKDEEARRKAIALTSPMFPDEAVIEPHLKEVPQLPKTDITVEAISEKEKAYLEVIQCVQEQLNTIWIAESHRQLFLNQLPLTISSALSIGLTVSEVSCALQIGELSNHETITETKKNIDSIEPSMSEHIPVRVEHETDPQGLYNAGLRKQLRGKHLKLRKRTLNGNISV